MQSWRLGLLLFLISNMAFAVQPMDLTLAVPATAIVVGIFLATASMLTTAIADPRLQAWVKTEFREFIAGLILITIITTFIIGTDGVTSVLTGTAGYEGSSGYGAVAEEILDGWLSNFDSAFEKVIAAATRIRAAATYAPYMNIPLWIISINYSTAPIAGIGILLGSLNLAAQGLTNAIFLGEGLRMLVSFLNITAPTVLIPLAFAIRLIPFTRKLGNTLIAISVAGMVFLPFSVILAAELNKNINVPEPSINLSELDANPWAMVIMEPLCETAVVRTLLLSTDVGFALIVCLLAGPFFTICYNIVKEIVYPILNMVFQIVVTLLLAIWEAAYAGALGEDYANAVFDAVYPFLRDVNNLVLVGYIDFIIIAIVTLVGARSLSTALGGEWYMAGIQRLI